MEDNTVNETVSEEKAKLLNRMEEREKEARKRSEKSPFNNFVQLNREELEHVLKACQEKPVAVRVLFFIIKHMDKRNALMCPYKVFQEELDISQATVARCIEYLINTGFIVTYKVGTNNVYIVNDQLAWTNKASKLKYSDFPTDVRLSAYVPVKAKKEETDKKKSMPDKELRFDQTKALHKQEKKIRKQGYEKRKRTQKNNT